MHHTQELHELEEFEQEHVDRVFQALTTPCTPMESLAEVAHDARNMVTALDLYCDLLEEPGVVAAPFAHYGGELRLIAAASRRLVDKLVALGPDAPTAGFAGGASLSRKEISSDSQILPWKIVPIHPIVNLAEELLANRYLLASLAGPTITLSVDVEGGAVPIRMTAEDLTRILVNLVKNATDAMSAVGRIHIWLWEGPGEEGERLTLNVEDNGPGLSDSILERISEREPSGNGASDLPLRRNGQLVRRGLGLGIVRSIVEAAGGTMHAMNRDPVGASFQIELPISRPITLKPASDQSRVIQPTKPE